MSMDMQALVVYKLNDKREVEPVDILEWGQWMAESREERQVALDQIGPVTVSTAFVGLNLSVGMIKPAYFETLVQLPIAGGNLTKRYATWAEAEEGHKVAMDEVRAFVAKRGPHPGAH